MVKILVSAPEGRKLGIRKPISLMVLQRCKPRSCEDFLLPAPVLRRLFRAKMLALLKAVHAAGKLQFFNEHGHLADAAAVKAFLGPLYRIKGHVYAKRPFAGPEQVLAYLARYTHRVAF